MTDPAKAWFPSGDVAFPDRMTALQIIDDPTVEREAIAELAEHEK